MARGLPCHVTHTQMRSEMYATEMCIHLLKSVSLCFFLHRSWMSNAKIRNENQTKTLTRTSTWAEWKRNAATDTVANATIPITMHSRNSRIETAPVQYNDTTIATTTTTKRIDSMRQRSGCRGIRNCVFALFPIALVQTLSNGDDCFCYIVTLNHVLSVNFSRFCFIILSKRELDSRCIIWFVSMSKKCWFLLLFV